MAFNMAFNIRDQSEPANSAWATKPTSQVRLHFKPWVLKAETYRYQNKQEQTKHVCVQHVAAYSNSDIVVLDQPSSNLIIIPSKRNPEPIIHLQEWSIGCPVTRLTSVTLNKHDEVIVLNDRTVYIFRWKSYVNPYKFSLRGTPSCIAVDEHNKIAVGDHLNAMISLHIPDGSLIRRLPAPGIDEYLTTYKQRLIYTNWNDKKLVSVTYDGEMVFSVDINQSGRPRGVCCDKDGSIYVAVWRTQYSPQGDIHHYSPDGKYIGCIIEDCDHPNDIAITPAGDLVVATSKSVQIYQHV